MPVFSVNIFLVQENFPMKKRIALESVEMYNKTQIENELIIPTIFLILCTLTYMSKNDDTYGVWS